MKGLHYYRNRPGRVREGETPVWVGIVILGWVVLLVSADIEKSLAWLF